MLSICFLRMSRSKLLVFALILQILAMTTMADKCEMYDSYNSLALIYNKKGICAGVLVHPSWVLFGHCCMKRRIGFENINCMEIRNLYEPYQIRKVTKVERCTRCGIGMMKVDKPFSVGKVFKLIVTPHEDEEIPCATIVYAHLSFKHPWAKNSLFTYCTEIHVKDKDECWDDCGEKCKEKKICGSYTPLSAKSGVDLCMYKNHTGGALFCKDKVVGFLDWTSCDKYGKNELVFFNLAKCVDFIRDTIGGSGKRSEKVQGGKSANGASRSRIDSWILGTFGMIGFFLFFF